MKLSHRHTRSQGILVLLTEFVCQCSQGDTPGEEQKRIVVVRGNYSFNSSSGEKERRWRHRSPSFRPSESIGSITQRGQDSLTYYRCFLPSEEPLLRLTRRIHHRCTFHAPCWNEWTFPGLFFLFSLRLIDISSSPFALIILSLGYEAV